MTAMGHAHHIVRSRRSRHVRVPPFTEFCPVLFDRRRMLLRLKSQILVATTVNLGVGSWNLANSIRSVLQLCHHEGLRTSASATFSGPQAAHLQMRTPPLSKRFRPPIILSTTM